MLTGISRLHALVVLATIVPLLVRGIPVDEADPEGASAARVVNRRLRLSPKRIAPDGIERIAAVVEGTMPGPVIRAQKGDVINVNVVNNLNNANLHHSTSLHWHGIHLMNKNYNDGAATVTQCPITPNHAYEYNVPTRGQAGTFWYHSHFSSQYCDGVRGPLIIQDPQDPQKHLYDIDNDSTIISLADWYETPAKLAYHPGPGKLPPEPRSTLINGVGIAHRTNGQSGTHAVISVRPNRRYRMRLINMACDPAYRFSIDGHMLKVIEADSLPVRPMDVDGLEIFAGQRYSFVLNTNQRIGNYWVRALPNRAIEKTFDNNINTAVLRYIGAPIRLPPKPANVDIPVLNNLLVESHLEPLQNKPVPGVHELGKADVNLVLETGVHDSGLISLGNQSFTPPSVPILLQIMSGARKVEDMDPKGSLYSLPPNKVIEITLPGDGIAGPHPFHLHGHDFWVVKPVDGIEPKWMDAIMRDTVSAGVYNESVTIRFVTDNSGPWFLHCHIDWHLDSGMGVVMVEDAEGTAQKQKPTKAWNNLCPIYNKYKENGGQD